MKLFAITFIRAGRMENGLEKKTISISRLPKNRCHLGG